MSQSIYTPATNQTSCNPAPEEPGHYWGRWHSPAPGTVDDGECCDGEEWEVHQVFVNSVEPGPDRLRVFVPGVEESQPLDGFEWGPEVLKPINEENAR